MERPEGIILLACVCFLLVIVLSAVESGRVVGANYRAGLPILGFNFSLPRTNYQLNPMGNVNQSNSKATQNPQPNLTSQNPFISLAPLPFLPTLPDWLLPVLAVACFVGACFLILRLKTSESVVDLEETIKQMEMQQKRLAESWSYKLRNMALLRYYVLMRRACSSVGLQEKLTETPKEYIDRASSFLQVDSAHAIRFADAVNRCRYGEELTGEDASEASKFMSDFTDVIRRRTNAP